MKSLYSFQFTVVIALFLLHHASSVDLEVKISPYLFDQNVEGRYRLDYWPPEGFPAPNTSFPQSSFRNGFVINQVKPGSKYDLSLYFSNRTFQDVLEWSSSAISEPLPPTSLFTSVATTSAKLSWSRPLVGGVSSYKLRVVPHSEIQTSVQNIIIDGQSSQFLLRDLVAGASYGLELYSLFEGISSVNAETTNITTVPNSPGRFIVWYRNQTTMLVLWQPSYPPGVFSNYKVSIDPAHARDSVLLLEKNEGPSQAAFYGLRPGQPYNISIQTISGSRISAPTTAQYRTIPLAPTNLAFDYSSLGETSFVVKWNAPVGDSVFDRYVVSFGQMKQSISKGEPTSALFSQGVKPGRTYLVEVKAVSLNVFSWPSAANVTTRPSSVVNLTSTIDQKTGEVYLTWQAAPDSIQDHYQVSYQEQEVFNGDSDIFSTTETMFRISSLLPGRNYSLVVFAVSNGIISKKASDNLLTKPSTPIIENLQPFPEGLNISWKSDVTSHQDKYLIIFTRNDTGATRTLETYIPFAELKDLFPGAVYEIKIYSMSHNIRSDPHKYFQAVFPNPVGNLTITSITSDSLELAWTPPLNSRYDGFIVRYRASQSSWNEIELNANRTWYTLRDLLPGYQYTVQLTAVRNRVESWNPVSLVEVLPPANAEARDVRVVTGTHNATLFWRSSAGHADSYVVSWWPSGSASKKKSTKLDGSNQTDMLVIDIPSLRPGEQYVFELYSVANGLESAKIKLDNRTQPLLLSSIRYNSDILEPTSLTVEYTATPASSTNFDLYRCRVFDLSAEKNDERRVSEQEHLSNDPNRSFIYRGLVPGRLYRVSMWTVSGGVTSAAKSQELRLFPAPVSQINASSITTTEIRLVWNEPIGDHDGFEIFYGISSEGQMKELVVHQQHTLQNLIPFKNYSVTIRALSGSQSRDMQRSRPLTVFFTTAESVPERVDVFRAVQKTPREVRLQWNLPEAQQNGVLQSYTIYYGEKDSKEVKVRNFSPHVTEGIISDLDPGRTFRFKIQGRTRIGYGASSMLDVKMPVWPPPRPNTRVFPTEVSKNDTTIHIRFRRNYFSDDNGPVIAYSIIVAEDLSADSSSLELPGWRDVQSYSVWPPFQVNPPYNPFLKNKSVEDFYIGTDHACGTKCVRGERCFCNGPLRAGTSYSVKIRAFTAPTMFADTAYSHRIRTERSYSNLFAAVFVPILLLIILALAFVVMRRKRLGPFRCSASVKEMRRQKEENMSMRGSIIETSRPVKLKDFIEHYRFMSADSDIRFSEEYEDLKHVGRDQPCTAADYPCNRPKNRFTNILPYDHSRFKLQPTDDEEGSDYINANYVPGFNSPREFIVSQGPLHSTRDDFWRMVWESNSRAIVMLTRCVEKGREKCDQYWPCDTQPQFYGEIHVVTLNQTQLPDWTVSEFRVTRGHVSRVIRHFHFTTWPDFGVPEPPQILVRFVRAFRDRVPYDQRPIITHCSAGVGRSGTFIALDRVLQHIVRYDYVDIFGMVYEMRRERVLMVQTEVQYICIHTSLKVVLEGAEDDDLSPAVLMAAGSSSAAVPKSSITQIHSNMAYDDDEGIVEP